MRAAVVEELGGTPRLVEFEEPAGIDDVGTVVAASVNPIDRVIANGRIAFRSPTPPTVLGLDGVARDTNGALQYFFAPQLPFGSFAERVPLAGAETTAVPGGLDAVQAAALGVPGIAAWLSVTSAGRVKAGASVLVLGATGAVGQLAVQVAKVLGASTVAGTARNPGGLSLVERLGGTPVSIADLATLDAALSAVAPNGFDVVVDMLWGAPLAVSARHLATGARVVQVGNSAGSEASIDAPAFRNKGAIMLGHSNFLVSSEERRAAYAQMAELAVQGRIQIAADPVPFTDFESVWQGNGPSRPVFTL